MCWNVVGDRFYTLEPSGLGLAGADTDLLTHLLAGRRALGWDGFTTKDPCTSAPVVVIRLLTAVKPTPQPIL